jgi:hypothetical protein
MSDERTPDEVRRGRVMRQLSEELLSTIEQNDHRDDIQVVIGALSLAMGAIASFATEPARVVEIASRVVLQSVALHIAARVEGGE